VKRSNWVFQWMLALVTLIGASACGGTAHFGPYQGKVIDAETGEPIEGAVVLIAFYTERHTLGGNVSRFEDAVETLTDKNGEFRIPVRTISVTRFMHEWRPFGHATIFKPGYAGYGCFPRHKDVQPHIVPSSTIPRNEYVTISLPMLKNVEERRRQSCRPGGVPDDKMKHLRRLLDIEREGIGAKPYEGQRRLSK
jgi:hypothetical protein